VADEKEEQAERGARRDAVGDGPAPPRPAMPGTALVSLAELASTIATRQRITAAVSATVSTASTCALQVAGLRPSLVDSIM
jgi:hypothetical protein